MSIEIISNKDDILKFEIKSVNDNHISDAFVNTIRKICISHVPVYAVPYEKYKFDK